LSNCMGIRAIGLENKALSRDHPPGIPKCLNQNIMDHSSAYLESNLKQVSREAPSGYS